MIKLFHSLFFTILSTKTWPDKSYPRLLCVCATQYHNKTQYQYQYHNKTQYQYQFTSTSTSITIKSSTSTSTNSNTNTNTSITIKSIIFVCSSNQLFWKLVNFWQVMSSLALSVYRTASQVTSSQVKSNCKSSKFFSDNFVQVSFYHTTKTLSINCQEEEEEG